MPLCHEANEETLSLSLSFSTLDGPRAGERGELFAPLSSLGNAPRSGGMIK